MCIYRDFIRRLLFQFDPEFAHYLAHHVIGIVLPVLAPFSKGLIYEKSDLSIELLGTRLANPIGLSAGFDKNGDLVHSLKFLGFGFAEIGSVSNLEHEGNSKPRMWRLPEDNALINWMGLNSEGAVKVSEKLARSNFSLPISVNIVKSNKPEVKGERAVEDLLSTFRAIRHLPVMYVAINISCVNTADGIWQETNVLSSFLEFIGSENTNKLPILIKLSEDGSDELIEKIVEVGKKYNVAGFICGNTTRQRPALKTEKSVVDSIKNGGLSGSPIKQLVLPLCRKVYRLKKPEQIIIGNGGISTGQDVYDYIRAGSSAVQLYTALIYNGPRTVRNICDELSALLHRDGLSVKSACGLDI